MVWGHRLCDLLSTPSFQPPLLYVDAGLQSCMCKHVYIICMDVASCVHVWGIKVQLGHFDHGHVRSQLAPQHLCRGRAEGQQQPESSPPGGVLQPLFLEVSGTPRVKLCQIRAAIAAKGQQGHLKDGHRIPDMRCMMVL